MCVCVCVCVCVRLLERGVYWRGAFIKYFYEYRGGVYWRGIYLIVGVYCNKYGTRESGFLVAVGFSCQSNIIGSIHNLAGILIFFLPEDSTCSHIY